MVPKGVSFFDSKWDISFFCFPAVKTGRSNHCAKAERGFHEEAANSLSSAESQERQLQLQRKRLEEEVDSGKKSRMG